MVFFTYNARQFTLPFPVSVVELTHTFVVELAEFSKYVEPIQPSVAEVIQQRNVYPVTLGAVTIWFDAYSLLIVIETFAEVIGVL